MLFAEIAPYLVGSRGLLKLLLAPHFFKLSLCSESANELQYVQFHKHKLEMYTGNPLL